MATRVRRSREEGVRTRRNGGRIVISVNLPIGLYQELLKLMETGGYVHLSDLIRAALRFYIDYHRRLYSRPPGLVLA